MNLVKWFREWRAWVNAKRESRENDLVEAVSGLVESKYWVTPAARAVRIIAEVRQHDRGGVA